MHSILFVLIKPEMKEFDALSRWEAVTSKIAQKVKHTAEVELYYEGVLLIRGSNALPALGVAIATADAQSFSYKILFIEEGTEWNHTPHAM